MIFERFMRWVLREMFREALRRHYNELDLNVFAHQAIREARWVKGRVIDEHSEEKP